MARQGFIGKLIYEKDLFRQQHDMAFSKHNKQA